MNFGELLTASQMDGGIDDPKKKKVPTKAEEMKVLYKKPFKYDNKPAHELTRTVAEKMGVDPSMLFSSAFQEGLNQYLSNPDAVEKTMQKEGWYNKDYPVSGYETYGLDTFGSRFDEFVQKGYLPPEFKDQFNIVHATNDHMKGVVDPITKKAVIDPKTGKQKMIDDPQPIVTADFKTNEAALMAKAAFIKAEQESVKNYAKQKGVELSPDEINYFTLASYNSGFRPKGAQGMMDEYLTTKDKQGYLKKGSANRGWQNIHQNVAPRLETMKVVNQLYAQNPLGVPAPPPTPIQQPIIQ